MFFIEQEGFMEQWQKKVLKKLRNAKETKAPITFTLYEIIKLTQLIETPLFRWHDHENKRSKR
ncbi:MAG: hypothetical protein Q8Q95_04660 [bacterium]|nr:hypothetical protein [bacterium]